ncbi:MAG: hypothetical protein CMK87_06180 [Pseudomonadales bacterium]|nr:hypothetical protein [Pseudomonadales bacterium]MAY08154.1 hypothetical protein [Pseudomonadales bacterium]
MQGKCQQDAILGWKLEAGSWKLEAGSWKLEAGSWKPIVWVGASYPARVELHRRRPRHRRHPDQLDAPRWRTASNRQMPVATETLRLLTLPAIGSLAR